MTDTGKEKINYALDMAISDAPVKMTIDQVKLVREDILSTLSAAGFVIVRRPDPGGE